MGDAKDSWMNEVKDNRVLKDDGNYYWIMRVNAKDAAARGIADGDLIRAFNDRGSVILAAQVTERVPPGTVHSYESCGDYEPLGEPGHSPDISGCVNILTPKRYHHSHLDGDGQQLLSDPGGEMGRFGRRERRGRGTRRVEGGGVMAAGC